MTNHGSFCWDAAWRPLPSYIYLGREHFAHNSHTKPCFFCLFQVCYEIDVMRLSTMRVVWEVPDSSTLLVDHCPSSCLREIPPWRLRARPLAEPAPLAETAQTRAPLPHPLPLAERRTELLAHRMRLHGSVRTEFLRTERALRVRETTIVDHVEVKVEVKEESSDVESLEVEEISDFAEEEEPRHARRPRTPSRPPKRRRVATAEDSTVGKSWMLFVPFLD